MAAIDAAVVGGRLPDGPVRADGPRRDRRQPGRRPDHLGRLRGGRALPAVAHPGAHGGGRHARAQDGPGLLPLRRRRRAAGPRAGCRGRRRRRWRSRRRDRRAARAGDHQRGLSRGRGGGGRAARHRPGDAARRRPPYGPFERARALGLGAVVAAWRASSGTTASATASPRRSGRSPRSERGRRRERAGSGCPAAPSAWRRASIPVAQPCWCRRCRRPANRRRLRGAVAPIVLWARDGRRALGWRPSVAASLEVDRARSCAACVAAGHRPVRLRGRGGPLALSVGCCGGAVLRPVGDAGTGGRCAGAFKATVSGVAIRTGRSPSAAGSTGSLVLGPLGGNLLQADVFGWCKSAAIQGRPDAGHARGGRRRLHRRRHRPADALVVAAHRRPRGLRRASSTTIAAVGDLYAGAPPLPPDRPAPTIPA